MRAVQAVHPECHPAGAAFEKTHAQTGKLVEHAVINHASERDDQRQRMAERVNRHEGLEGIQTHAVMRPAVHAQRTTQALRLGVNRPVGLVTQVEGQAARRQHRADEAQFGNRPAQLDHCFVNVLQR